MVNSGMHFVHPAEIIPMEEETDDDETEIPFNVSYWTLHLICNALACFTLLMNVDNSCLYLFSSSPATLTCFHLSNLTVGVQLLGSEKLS